MALWVSAAFASTVYLPTCRFKPLGFDRFPQRQCASSLGICFYLALPATFRRVFFAFFNLLTTFNPTKNPPYLGIKPILCRQLQLKIICNLDSISLIIRCNMADGLFNVSFAGNIEYDGRARFFVIPTGANNRNVLFVQNSQCFLKPGNTPIQYMVARQHTAINTCGCNTEYIIWVHAVMYLFVRQVIINLVMAVSRFMIFRSG